MKKLFFLLLSLYSLPLAAQKTFHAFNLMLGPSLCWYKPTDNAVLNGIPSNHNVNGLGYLLALHYEYQKATYLGFTTAIGFEHTTAGIFRNYDINGDNQPFQDSSFIHTLSMNTIDIPIMLKIRLFNGRYAVSYTYFNLGPGIQLLLGDGRTVRVNNYGYDAKYPQKSDHPHFNNRLTPYLRLAMGRKIITRKYNFLIELALNSGLGQWHFNRYPDLRSNEEISFRRNSLMLNLGVQLQNYRQPGCHEF